jgi:hypothetical protein
MNPSTAWQRLTVAARRAPDTRDTAAPFGFSARVAAQALASPRRQASIFDQFSLRVSLRVLGAACALAVTAVSVSYPTVAGLFSGGVAPASSLSSRLSPAGPGSPESPAAVEIPSVDTPPATPSTGDDPVAELVDVVS